MAKSKKTQASTGEVVTGELITFHSQLTKFNATDSPKSNALDDYREQILQRHMVCMIFGVNHLKSMIHCGEALLEVKGLLEHGQFNKWVKSSFAPDTGLSLRTCQRYMAKAREFRKFLAKMEKSLDHDATVLSCLEDNDLFLAFTDQFASSDNITNDSEEWKTPSVVLDAARKVIGTIECDPCASPFFKITGANGAAFDKDANGLDASAIWQGSTFISPGLRLSILPWLEKATASISDGQVPSAIAFFPAQFSAAVVRVLVGNPICLLNGPLTTVAYKNNVSGTSMGEFAINQAMAAAFIGAGKKAARFIDAFSKLGTVIVPVAHSEANESEIDSSALFDQVKLIEVPLGPIQ